MQFKELEKVLFTEQQIAEKIEEIAKSIDNDYKDKNNLLLVGILKGSYMFLSDLSRALTTPHQIDFMSVSSYADTKSTGNVKIECDLRNSIKGKSVLIVEDIVDTGRTLSHLQKLLIDRQADSVEIVTLFSKPTERVVNVPGCSYVGFELVPPEFIVGYGMDFNEHFRDLGYVGVPTKDTIERLSTSSVTSVTSVTKATGETNDDKSS